MKRAIMGMMVAGLGACVPPMGEEPDPSVGTTEDTAQTGDGPDGDGSGDSSGRLDDTGSATGDDTDTDADTDTDQPPNDPGDPFEPPPPVEPLPDAELQALQAAIDGWLASPSVDFAEHGVLITDPAADQVLYERNPDVLRIPASNTKLFSTAAAMGGLGEDHRAHTEVWAGSEIDGDGAVSGDLILVGDHDFTWSTQLFPTARAPLDLLAQDLYDAGLRSVSGELLAQGEFLYDGYQFGYYDPPTHRLDAVTQFRNALAAVGITVAGGNATASNFDPPPGSTMLAALLAPPLSVGAVPINVISHNEFADILLRHIGWELGGTSDYGTGASELQGWMNALGLDGDGVVFNDGSGLSHGNDVTPRHVIDLLDAMTRQPEGEAWRRTFAIASVRGTLGGRMGGPDTAGRVHGKTGTLTGVIATSGVIYNRHDRREYLFSILMNNTGPSNSATRDVHDGIIGEVAADIRGLGSPPAAPVLRAVRHDPGTAVVRIEWDPVEDAEGYLVWLSPDGLVWDRADARYVTETQHRAGQLPPTWTQAFVRVAAVGPAGEGDASDVYSASIDDADPRILIVDGNDRWQAQPVPENPLGRGHDFAAVHARALIEAGAGWDTAANEAVIDDLLALEEYDLVIWTLGEESTEHETFSDAEQPLVAAYLAAEGALFVSGAEIGWDLGLSGTAGDQQFLAEALHAEFVGDESATFLVQPTGPLADLPRWGFRTPGAQVINFADQLDPTADSESIAQYVQGFGGSAGVYHDGPGPVLILGFPFESLDNAPDRAELMGRALELLL